MANILFASNSISHFPGSTIGTAAWSFSSNRVPYSIETPLLTKCGSPTLAPSPTDEWWFHFRTGMMEYYVNSEEPLIEIDDSDGNRIFMLAFHNRSTEGYHSYFVVDGSSYAAVRYIPMPPNMMRTYDIQMKFTGLTAEVRVYVNEMLIETFVVSVASWKAPSSFSIGGHLGNNFNTTSYRCYYSEIIVADADTRNARLDLLRPIAVGVYDAWNGPVLSLSDDDPTTGMTTTVPNASQSTVLTPYTGANNISNVVQITTSVRGINSPTQLQHLIRMSGVDYLTSNFAVPFSKDYQITDWSQNPATSLPWAATDLVSAEFGFRSIA